VGQVDGGLELAFGQAGDDGNEGFGFGHGAVSFWWCSIIYISREAN
jgi:hypothetical protein